MHPRVKTALLGTLLVVLMASSLWWFEQQRTHTVIVTKDTTLVLPEQVVLIAGLRDTLIIRNDTDEQILLVGRPIAPRQQIRQRYRKPGTYTYVCTSHGGATMAVVVEPFDITTWLMR
jgi:plastocyanin